MNQHLLKHVGKKIRGYVKGQGGMFEGTIKEVTFNVLTLSQPGKTDVYMSAADISLFTLKAEQ